MYWWLSVGDSTTLSQEVQTSWKPVLIEQWIQALGGPEQRSFVLTPGCPSYAEAGRVQEESEVGAQVSTWQLMCWSTNSTHT